MASDYQAPADLEDRLILPLLNEAVACLHEGVVADADLLDAGVIFGTGFAPFRGGPIQHIRAVGADAIVERLKALQQRHGDRFARARAGTTPPCANRWSDYHTGLRPGTRRGNVKFHSSQSQSGSGFSVCWAGRCRVAGTP